MDERPRLARLLDAACGRHPDKIAIVSGDRQLSYAELRAMAAHLAGTLTAAGLAGDRIATLLPNGPELIGILSIDQLPLTHSGKLDHTALAANFASTRDR
jgi:non-ribosomal peptide synthetase component E (peptide arylation enzyme)